MPSGIYIRTPEMKNFKGNMFFSEETRAKMRNNRLGTKYSDKLKNKLSLIAKQKGFGKWLKGRFKKDASYAALHIWIKVERGSPNKCEYCGFTSDNKRKIHWANVSGEYKRELTDWIRLCIPCHRKYDRDDKFDDRDNEIRALHPRFSFSEIGRRYGMSPNGVSYIIKEKPNV